MKRALLHKYSDIICKANLFSAWQEFVIGKSSKLDVQVFGRNLFYNIEELHNALVSKTYQHGGYHSFYINDPKRRHIHKACVPDRLLHHAIYRLLYPFFEKTFIYDSYSCRLNKGVYKAIQRFDRFAYKVSQNNTQTVWILKCDIRKFFDSIDHRVLLSILREYIPDTDILWLLEDVVDSYHSEHKQGVGLPLGNLTSQLFANVYMNVFDQWVKHRLKQPYYIRYADDFLFLETSKSRLEDIREQIETFLYEELRLTLHPHKIVQKTFFSGIDFLGWHHFPHHKQLRKKTKERMFRRLADTPAEDVFQSYLGLLGHGNTYRVEQELRNMYWLLSD